MYSARKVDTPVSSLGHNPLFVQGRDHVQKPRSRLRRFFSTLILVLLFIFFILLSLSLGAVFIWASIKFFRQLN